MEKIKCFLAARHGHHRFGYAMCGFSAAIPNDGLEKIYIGAPGAYYWQGTIFAQSLKNQTDRPNTKDGPPHHDNHNLGKIFSKLYKTFYGNCNSFFNTFTLI